ncbi:MAG: hypothetical protein AAF458_09990 [Pseudomonadota bacterium]
MPRHALITFLVVALSTAAVTATAHSYAGAKGVVEITSAGVYVFRGPDHRSGVVGRLEVGDAVKGHEQHGKWLAVQGHGSNGPVTGWIQARYARSLPTSAYAANPSRHAHQADRHGYVVRPTPIGRTPGSRGGRAQIDPEDYDYVYMFAGPDRYSPVLARLDGGDQVRILKRGPTWSYIAMRGIGRGFVPTDALEQI